MLHVTVTKWTGSTVLFTAMLDEIKAMFPAGTSWGDGTNGGGLIEYKNSNNIATHWVVVIGVTTEATTILINGVPTPGPVDTFITLCDGNNGAQVQWGGGLWLNAQILKGSPNSILYTAY